ncbi:MAG TPA: hypothetical protein VJ648_03575 [Vicinamibacteria bacterium]|nr:hypothetical protein [Vicinamibacteria bacterium]
MKPDRAAASVDALFADALRAGESRARARELVAACADETVLAAVLHRAVPVAFLEAVASVPPWSERPRVLARVVLHPRAPRVLSLKLVSALYWRDLAEVAATLRVAAAVRSRAESLLKDGLADMRLGDRITLARLATPALLPLLLADGERQVAEAALVNARLREEDVTTALRRDDVRPALVEAVAAAQRWQASYAVKLALVLQPKTPLALGLPQILSLVPRDLRRVAFDETLRPLVRAAAREVLERENEPI